MQTEKKFANLAVMAVGTLLLVFSSLATAESDTARAIRASAATTPTNIPGIRAYAEPPKGFNAVTATDEELATYGFPPRPDKEGHPDQYAEWERAMRAAKIRWNGKLKTVPGSERLVMPAGSALPEAVEPETGPKQTQTTYASGVIVASGQKTFNKKSIYQIDGEIIVPQVRKPFDSTSCSGQGYITVDAVGIDGFVFNTGNGYGYDPQLEAGVFGQVSCSGDIYYFAVVGWQGNYNVAFNVNPGDVVYAVASTLGGSDSEVYLADYTTGTGASYSVTTSDIVGAYGNWVVERVCCSGNEPIPMANTVNIAFGGVEYATTGSDKLLYAGSQAATTQILTMTDDAGDQEIETVRQGSTGIMGLNGLWFTTVNCAYEGGCTP